MANVIILSTYFLMALARLSAIPAVRGTGALPESYSFLTVKAKNVIAETVKRAEDSEDTVVRLYEAKNRKTATTVHFGFPVEKAYLCDLEENPQKALKCENDTLHVTLKPYEIVTLKVIKK